jgi:hypothetical protein
MIERIAVMLAAWCAAGAVVAVIAGRIIAFGQHPFTERLAEVEADREHDEALFV